MSSAIALAIAYVQSYYVLWPWGQFELYQNFSATTRQPISNWTCMALLFASGKMNEFVKMYKDTVAVRQLEKV